MTSQLGSDSVSTGDATESPPPSASVFNVKESNKPCVQAYHRRLFAVHSPETDRAHTLCSLPRPCCGPIRQRLRQTELGTERPPSLLFLYQTALQREEETDVSKRVYPSKLLIQSKSKENIKSRYKEEIWDTYPQVLMLKIVLIWCLFDLEKMNTIFFFQQ